MLFRSSGGGQSLYEPEPIYQASFKIPSNPEGRRGIPDVAYNADPYNGFAIYDSVRFRWAAGWFQVGGTSAGPPQWAGLIAIVNSLRVAKRKFPLTGSNESLYRAANNAPNYGSNFHDIVTGINGSCGDLCTAVPGYDYVTGLGTPRADQLIMKLVNAP